MGDEEREKTWAARLDIRDDERRRARALAKEMRRLPEFAALQVHSLEVLHMAVLYGIEALEAKYLAGTGSDERTSGSDGARPNLRPVM